MPATRADARPTKPEKRGQPNPATMDNHSLVVRRRRLAAELEDVSDSGRDAVEFELHRVEDEIDARRRRTERVEAARLGREEREREEQAAVKAAARETARVEFARLAGEREEADQAIDEALPVLVAALDHWRRVTEAQADAGNAVGGDRAEILNQNVLSTRIAHELALVLPRSTFRRWADHPDRDKPFAAIDAPMCALVPEETTP